MPIKIGGFSFQRDSRYDQYKDIGVMSGDLETKETRSATNAAANGQKCKQLYVWCHLQERKRCQVQLEHFAQWKLRGASGVCEHW